MKNIIAAIAFLLVANLVMAQPAESWYKIFTGNAGSLAATIHLHKAGKNYSGYIWFAQNQWPMQIYNGEPVAKTDSFMLSAGSGPVSIVLTGIMGDNSFTGNSRLIKEGSPSKSAAFQLQVSTEKIFTPFNYVFAEGNAKLPAQFKNESQADYFSAAIWPSGKNLLDEAVKKQVREMLTIKVPAIETGKWMTDEKNKMLANWKKENTKMTPAETAELGLSLSFQQENRVMVMYENEQLINLAHVRYEFSGGAHGNYTTTLPTIKKETGKKLHLTDVLTATGIKLLPTLLDQVARLQFGIKNKLPLDQNGFLVNRIAPSQNMYVTSSGIGFLYSPYEIKSFADGEVNLLIPFTALKGYLQQGFGE